MNSPAPVLDQLLAPLAKCLTPDTARRIVEMRLEPETEARLEALRGKASDGALTDSERAEYQDFIEGLDLIGILKAKARELVGRRPA
jgi:hypothetical protein